ncbi:CBS domain-containing protein [Halorubrum sp. JWXQ-INN 858]|uniref:site-2 protease family protein n=1 Tax=Halorubrum sp. JWXQ-INN 858 TaxID=2690782 RepID=UPI00135AAB03|nr:site-2 protease family protein [Halorubrum sp. JWXQ-INN 858]MWV63354.1 CBS domain-containing protein [Halorubrum sp. JWXQ-INN 858]
MRSYTVGRIWGIPIRINVSLVVFLPLLAYLIGSGEGIGLYAGIIGGLAGTELDPVALADSRWTIGIAASVGLFVGVLLHELGHAWMARRYGVGIESITLWIFGGVAALESVPKEWDREFWIAIIGPITSVGVGVVFLGLLQVVPTSQPVLLFVVGWLGVINVVLAVFNCIPAFPMDGGRVLRALLARTRPYATATRIAARVGIGFGLLFVVFGVLAFDLILVVVGLFVYGAAKSESRITTIADLLEGLTVRDLLSTEPETIPADATLEAFADRMFATRRTSFPVERDGEIVGVVSLDALRRGRGLDRSTTTVTEVSSTSPVRVGIGDDAFEALVAINAARAEYALVEDAAGDVAGIVTVADFAETMQFAATAGKPARESPLDDGIV